MEIRPLKTIHPPRLPVPVTKAGESRYPFVPFGLVPLVGLALLLFVAVVPFAFGEVQAVTEATARAALQKAGATWAKASASGQWVILEGKPPSREAAFEAERAVRQAQAKTLFGQATPATWVISHFTWVEDPLLPPGTLRPRIPGPEGRGNAEANPPPTQAEAEACDQSMANLLANAHIEFPSKSSEIDASSDSLLDAIAAAAGYCRGSLRIEGHTDGVGSDAANIALSRRRAEAVRTALVERGISPYRLIAQGHGATKPVAENDTEQGRARNRRIEIRTVRTSPS